MCTAGMPLRYPIEVGKCALIFKNNKTTLLATKQQQQQQYDITNKPTNHNMVTEKVDWEHNSALRTVQLQKDTAVIRKFEEYNTVHDLCAYIVLFNKYFLIMIWLDYPTQYAQMFCWPCLHRRTDPPTGTESGANRQGKISY